MLLTETYPLTTAEEMRELDRRAIQDRGMPGVVLMENAGRGCAEVVLDVLGDVGGDRVAVLCGPGNNGGDGFVVARHLSNLGVGVDVYLLASPEKMKGDALVNLKVLTSGTEVVPVEIRSEEDLTRQEARISAAHVLVDALFGTGLGRDVEGLFLQAIELMNELDKPVVSVDMPSGLSSETGIPLGWAVEASVTVTFGCLKRGQALYPGFGYCGDLYLADIGFPYGLIEDTDFNVWFMGLDSARELLPNRPAEGHKGTFGHVLVVAGRQGFTGAAAMAGLGALKSGAALATLAGTSDSLAQSMAHSPELMGFQIETGEDSAVNDDSLALLVEKADATDVVAMGPGLGTGPYGGSLVEGLLPAVRRPMVLDADALNVLAGSPESLRRAGAEVVITPHPGEMARLLGIQTKDVQADRIEVARRTAGEFGVHVVLKGAHTVCAEPGGKAWVIPTGNHGMATAGSGDVLTGIVAGLIAQGVEPGDAGRLGAFIHGLAGDMASEESNPRSVTSKDILDMLGHAYNTVEEEPEE